MSRFFLALFTVFISFALPIQDAEAKRFGGGRSSGMQRDAMPQRQALPPQKQATSAAPANSAANQAGKRSWMGPLAGLAAGLGLAALASHFGFGEEMANMLLIGLLVMGGLLVFRMLTRPKAQATQQNMQYAGATANAGTSGNITAFPGSVALGGASSQALEPTSTLPAGFDAEAFTRQAKLNFIRLQAAYDAGNLDDIREFTTPEMYAEIKLDMSDRGSASQRTEVMMLDAEVLECVEEATRLVVSVRFHGLIREEADKPANDFDEIWHLTKPVKGGSGWAVAGIQQATNA